MSALVIRANAARLPLADESVDLIVTSPPYFGLRSYRDTAYAVGVDGKVLEERVHFAGQIGSEPTPQAFLEALWVVLAECWRVLKPTGSCFVNLGDKRSGSGGHNNNGLASSTLGHHKGGGGPYAAAMQNAQDNGGPSAKSTLRGNGHVGGGPKIKATLRNAPDRYNQAAFGRRKSKMLLPHRFAIGCEDGLADPEGKGWIVRSDLVWQKLNGLPESVTDRCRDSHEYLFHLTKSERYFAAVDEVRDVATGPFRPVVYEAFADRDPERERQPGNAPIKSTPMGNNPLGKLPGSVWPLPSEPLRVSDEIKAHYNLPDHFAAFPTEMVRRVILGWSPSAICTGCGEGRRPVVEKSPMVVRPSARRLAAQANGEASRTAIGGTMESPATSTVTGYRCSCPPSTAQLPTRPSVVLDPFVGSGTTTMVARSLGRIGIGTDLSADYCRLAKWRTFQSGGGAKAVARTNREAQGTFGVVA